MNRFLKIRKIYNLTLENLAELSNWVSPISKTTFGYWEREMRMPTLENLQVYSAIFGLSLDWIAGISNIPYTEDSVTYGENIFFQQLEKTAFIRLGILEDDLYLKYEYRRDNYSLEVRAYILVILQIILRLEKKITDRQMFFYKRKCTWLLPNKNQC